MSYLSTGTCAYCAGHYIPTVLDRPDRTWCGACPDGEPPRPVDSGRRHGFRRKGDVPANLGTARVCRACSAWFAARPREAVCDVCIPPEKRTLRALKAPPGTAPRRPPSRRGKRAGQRGVKKGFREVYSDYLALTFRCPESDLRAARLECLVLAYEEAARQRWELGRTPVSPESYVSLETALWPYGRQLFLTTGKPRCKGPRGRDGGRTASAVPGGYPRLTRNGKLPSKRLPKGSLIRSLTVNYNATAAPLHQTPVGHVGREAAEDAERSVVRLEILAEREDAARAELEAAVDARINQRRGISADAATETAVA